MDEQIFQKAVAFAVKRRGTKGDAQSNSAELEYSIMNDKEVILRNKPLSGWRFPVVELTRVSIAELEGISDDLTPLWGEH